MEKEVCCADVEGADMFPLWLQVTVLCLSNYLQLLFALYKGSSFPSTMTNIPFFCWHWTPMSMLTEMGHGLHMDLPWHCGFLDKGEGLLLVKGCSFQILLETPPIVSVHLWLLAGCCAQIFKPNLGYLGCFKIRKDNNEVALNMMVSVLPGVKPGSSLPPMEIITCP